MGNPLAANCQAFVESGGSVTGVRLSYLPAPASKYELVKATLVDEQAAQGQTIATVHVLDRDGLPARIHCYMAWPWDGWQYPNSFENHLLPGSTKYPYEHVVTNKYNPPGVGPLAIYIGDESATVISDVIGGLGLPSGHHISFDLVFRERGGTPGSGEPGEGEPGGGGGGELPADLTERLQRLEDKIDRLSRHFGITP